MGLFGFVCLTSQLKALGDLLNLVFFSDMVIHHLYSRTSITQTSLAPWKFVRDMDSSSD